MKSYNSSKLIFSWYHTEYIARY